MSLLSIESKSCSECMKYTVYVCSGSQQKLDVINDLFAPHHIVSHKCNIKKMCITDKKIMIATPEQPIDEGTTLSCYTRIHNVATYIKNNRIILEENDKIVALESGIYGINEKYYDVCVLMVYENLTKKIMRYNSFGITIDSKLYYSYLDPSNDLSDSVSPIFVTINENRNEKIEEIEEIVGFDSTFGQYLCR